MCTMGLSDLRQRFVVPVAMLTVACGGGQPDEMVIVRDSAGVTIVENRGAVWGSGAGWTLATEPVLEIGATHDAPEYELAGVEDAIQLPDGRVVVADGGSREIRIYGPEGDFLGSSGRRGNAPGEFQLINDIGYGPGDSLWVYDFGTRRFTILTDSAELVRTVTLGSELSAVGSVGRLRDGSFIVREYWSTPAHTREIQTGLSRNPAAVARYTPDGSTLDTIGLFPGREVFIGSEAGRAVMSAPLFARSLSAAVRGDAIVVGDQATLELAIYASDGELLRLIRLPNVDLGVSREDFEAEIQARLAGEPEERRSRVRAHLEAMQVPETRPAYGRMLVDEGANIWIAAYAPFGREPREWHVLDPEGRLLGSVTLPERFRPLDIGDEWMVGVWRDEMDVERVRLYGILKG